MNTRLLVRFLSVLALSLASIAFTSAQCTLPEFSVTTTNDCPNAQFQVDVDVVNTGDAPSVALTWTVNGGSPTTLAGLPAGTYQLGPFASGSLIDLTVEHPEDDACDQTINEITGEPCAIQSCGPDTYTHCYGNSEAYVQSYQGTSSFPLRLQFNSGNVSGSGNDALVIRDGLSVTDPILFSGVGNAGNLTGVTVLSTNPDHALTLTMTSNTSFSCGDGGVSPPWNYTVGCLDCEPPVGTAGPVTTDCVAQEFTVAVNVSDMGTASSVQIANNLGEPETTITAPGSYTAGPFPIGTPVLLTLVNIQSTICSVALGTFENGFCPMQIACGEPAIEDSYCYGEFDVQTWLYEGTGPEPLALLFSAGTIESASWDHLDIYDGPDNTYPVLYTHDNTFDTEDLTGLLVISTGTSLYMEMSSDGSVSCSGGSMLTWFWTVGCLDCTQPVASYELVLDCDSSQFYIVTTISSLGSDSTITITNTAGAPSVGVTAPGVYNVGPFALGAEVQVNVVVENALCGVHSSVLTNAPCPLIGCGPYQFELCYTDNMDSTIVYQSPGPYPIAVLFNAGDLDPSGDHIEVYDGDDLQAPLVYSGPASGDLTGLLFTSTNPDNALCMRFVSDFFESCASADGYTPWNWSVSCLDCTNPAASFELIPDCLHNGYAVAVDVTDLGSSSEVRITDSWSNDTISGIGLGVTPIGPIPVGVSAVVTVIHGDNSFCRVNSPQLYYPADSCIVIACEPQTVEYCYANSDTAWFIYQSDAAVPITMVFTAGQLLADDIVMLYNGSDTSAQLVYAGSAGGAPAGLSLTSNNADHALTLLVASNGSGSCDDGTASPALEWTVSCGLVALEEPIDQGPLIHPDPSFGEIWLSPGAGFEDLVRIEVFDAVGRMVWDEQRSAAFMSAAPLRLTGLVAGRYTLRISSSTRTATAGFRLVK